MDNNEKMIVKLEGTINQLVVDCIAANHPKHSKRILRVFTRALARSFLLAVFCEIKDDDEKETLALAQTVLEEEVKSALPKKSEIEAMQMLAEALRRLNK